MIWETIPASTVAARIPLHLDVCDAAVGTLVDLHQRVGRVFAGSLEADDRPAAIWELSGHALGLARAYLALLRGGYIPAAGVIARALHETLFGLEAVADPENDAVRKHYFADHGIKAESARKAVGGTQKRVEAEGAEIDGNLRSLGKTLYEGLSGYAHNRRLAVREAVLDDAGGFAYGPHPNIYRRASHVSYAVDLLIQLVQQVSADLSLFAGFRDADESIGKPLVARLEEVEREYPLSTPL